MPFQGSINNISDKSALFIQQEEFHCFVDHAKASFVLCEVKNQEIKIIT